eukprot:COSAG02_NODE_39311_length_418_cov_1.451411_1_plen_80_part_01
MCSADVTELGTIRIRVELSYQRNALRIHQAQNVCTRQRLPQNLTRPKSIGTDLGLSRIDQVGDGVNEPIDVDGLSHCVAC